MKSARVLIKFGESMRIIFDSLRALRRRCIFILSFYPVEHSIFMNVTLAISVALIARERERETICVLLYIYIYIYIYICIRTDRVRVGPGQTSNFT